MASTRNKNTPGNYAAERFSSNKKHEEMMYIHGAQGQAMQTNFAGNGLIHGRIAGKDLARNACDVESRLFGIGSTNLETPQGDFTAEMYKLNSLHVMERTPLIMPKPLGIELNQRPMYLN